MDGGPVTKVEPPAAVEKPAEAPGKWQKIKGVVAKIKPKEQPPVLTAVPTELSLFSKKADELLLKIKTMEKDEAVKLLKSLYEYFSTYKMATPDAEAMSTLITTIAGERPDAWASILESKDKPSKGLIEFVGQVSPITLQQSVEPLTARDTVIILNILADAEKRKGKDFVKVLASMKTQFGVEFSTSEEMWLLSNWLKSNIVEKVAIEQQTAALQGKILGKLGINPELKYANNLPFIDNLRKMAEFGDSKAYLFASMKDEKYLKALEELGEKDLASIIRDAKDFDSLIEALKWEKGGIVIFEKGGTKFEGVSKASKYSEVAEALERSVKETAEDFAALKVITDLVKQYGVKAERIQKAAKYHQPIYEGSFWKAAAKTLIVTPLKWGYKAGKYPVAWPTLIALEIPKTPKGYTAKVGLGIVQVLWLGAIGCVGYYGYGKIKAKVTATKLTAMEDIRKELEKRGAKPTEDTLEFLVGKGAPIWTFIKSKTPVGGIYPGSKKAEELLYHPEKGGYYFNYSKINDFVKAVQKLSEKNPEMELKKILNNNLDKFVDDGYFVPHGLAFLAKFSKDFGFSTDATKYFMKNKKEFLLLYASVLNGSVPLSYVAAYKQKALEKAMDKFEGEAIITTANSLMDLLDKYAASGLIELGVFEKLAGNKESLNGFVLGKDELVYGDLAALCYAMIKPGYEDELELSHYLDLKLPYFTGPAEIAKWDSRFLDDPDAARFVMKYSKKDKGLFSWLNGHATTVKAYDMVKHLMGYENLVKTYEGDPAGLENYLTDMMNSDEGKQFGWLGKLSPTPVDVFSALPSEKEAAEEKVAPEKKKAAPKPKPAEVKPAAPKTGKKKPGKKKEEEAGAV